MCVCGVGVWWEVCGVWWEVCGVWWGVWWEVCGVCGHIQPLRIKIARCNISNKSLQ